MANILLDHDIGKGDLLVRAFGKAAGLGLFGAAFRFCCVGIWVEFA
jgi:hypothetical protein